MAVTVPDQETLTAIKGFWDKDPDLSSGFGPLRGGRLKTDPLPAVGALGVQQGEQPLPLPVERKAYAKMGVEQGPSQHQYFAPVTAGAGYIDYRKVTITGYGRRADMVTMASFLRSKIAWKDYRSSIQAFFTNSWLMVIRPLMEPHITEDETVKDGKDVWNCIADFEVVTTRTIAT